jgi:cbb3-type cytochrome oxidase maturation protein
MSVVIILMLASLGVGLVFVAAFVWSVRSGQYEDTLTPSLRVLLDDPATQIHSQKAAGIAAPCSDSEPSNGAANETKIKMKSNKITAGAAGTTVLALAAATATAYGGSSGSPSWQDDTISPVSNPIFFEDAKITSEVHPVYMYHFLPDTFHFAGGQVPLGGDVQVMAVQARYAVNDRLAIIATKDGYVQFQPDHTLASKYGWADVTAGLKYAVVDDEEDQLLVTPGLTVTVPVGSTDVWQGHGSGDENIFVSAEKGLNKFHLLANVGVYIPNDFDQNTAQLHYSLQLDYYVHQYFIPFFALNGYTVLSDGTQKLLGVVPLNTEGYDLINFGSSQASGTTQLTVGGGFRSRLVKNVDIGAAYEVGVVDPVGIFDSRVTVDVIWRF